MPLVYNVCIGLPEDLITRPLSSINAVFCTGALQLLISWLRSCQNVTMIINTVFSQIIAHVLTA